MKETVDAVLNEGLKKKKFFLCVFSRAEKEHEK